MVSRQERGLKGPWFKPRHRQHLIATIASYIYEDVLNLNLSKNQQTLSYHGSFTIRSQLVVTVGNSTCHDS